MAKDPAFLFYPGDWLGGVMTFSRSHKGAYMDLLMCQFNNGHMSLDDIKTVLGSDWEMWEIKLKSKFKQDEKGFFFNEKLENESIKRKRFTESRKENLTHKPTHMKAHMENGNINEDSINNGSKITPEPEISIWPTFNDFWDLYAKKVGKPKSEKLWKKIIQVEREKIMIHVEDYVRSTPDLVYRKHPATYLGNQSWNDEIVIKNGKPKFDIAESAKRIDEILKARGDS